MSKPSGKRPEYQYTIRRLSNQLKRNPSIRRVRPSFETGSAFTAACAHIALLSDYGNLALYRLNKNLVGLPYTAIFSAHYGAVQGPPDAETRICTFPTFDAFVDAYIWNFEHVLFSPPEIFLAHMKDNAITRRRQWAAIENLWRKEFACQS